MISIHQQRGQLGTGTAVDFYLLQLTPEMSHRMRLRLQVDTRHNQGQAINRDYDLPAFRANGHNLTGQHQMRQGLVQTTDEHLANLRRQHPDEQVVAFVGNGNLLANPGFVAWQNGQLYALAGEPVYSRAYSCLVSWQNGLVTVEDVWFAQENGRTILLQQKQHTIQDISNGVEFVTSGQPLLRHGCVRPLVQQVEAWYDTRHLVRPLMIRCNGAALYVPNAQLQRGLLRKAVCQPVQVKAEAVVDEQVVLPLTQAGWQQTARHNSQQTTVAAAYLQRQGLLAADADPSSPQTQAKAGQVAEQLFFQSLQQAGYQLVTEPRPLQEGEARCHHDSLEIFFFKAVYPHNMFVRWADGCWGFVLFPGLSGRSGITLPAAQQLLAGQLQVQDALLLDNGGDVRLWRQGRYQLPSSEGREQIRSLLAITQPSSAHINVASL